MVRLFRAAAAPLLCLLIAACGGDGLLLFPGRASAEVGIRGPEDGTIVSPGQTVPLGVDATGPSASASREMEIVLLSDAGQSVWRNRVPAPAEDEVLDLQLPDLAPGRYRLEITLFESGEQVQRRATTLFAVHQLPRITGIASFPPLITTSSPVLLKAELDVPQGTDPFLRWSWRGKAIAKGTAGNGGAELLWTAPPDEGVYAVTLEVFPVAPPAGGDFPFRSSIAMATDVYVSSADKGRRDELGPAASYWALFHLQADLADLGAGAARGKPATTIGSPRLVPAGDGFGYQLDGSSGFSVPRLILPREDGALTPFTVTVGATLDRLAEENRILSVQADGGFSFILGLDSTGAPELKLAAPGAAPVSVASAAPALAPGQRFVLSLSVIPRTNGLETRWFKDGVQYSSVLLDIVLPRLPDAGTSMIGGEKGFMGVVDELGVYYRDPAGRPATDADIFSKAARANAGNRLLLADGFDGLYLPEGFRTEGKASLEAGTLSLRPETAVVLPAVMPPAEGFTLSVELASASERAAGVRVSWEGSDTPFLETRIAAGPAGLELTLTGETLAATTPQGVRSWPVPKPPVENAGLLIRLSNPADAKAAMLISQLLALKPREKE